MQSATRRLAATAGYTLVELLISMGLLTIVMGATMGGLANVMKGNELVMTIAAMNNSVRAGLDLMVRDLLQVGSGLPSSHSVSIPNGAGSAAVRIPGPPGTAFTTAVGQLTMPAVMPRSGEGPVIDGVATDVLSVLMADNAFLDVLLTSVDVSEVVVAAGPDIENGPDRVTAGQLMMISKGSFNTLVQVTDVDYVTRTLTFGDGDSLNLNQSGAANGTTHPARKAASAAASSRAAANIPASTDPRQSRTRITSAASETSTSIRAREVSWGAIPSIPVRSACACTTMAGESRRAGSQAA